MKAGEFVIVFLFVGFLSPVFSAHSYVDQKADVNNDGQINVLDVLSVVNHILGTVMVDEEGSWRADCNGPEGNCAGDGVINIMDALKIVNIILGNDACGNTRPVASFTVSPASGSMETVFHVDASGSSDSEDMTASLGVRWDWENDGTYDTDWSTTKMNSHQYSTTGKMIIKLEVRDSGGLLNTEMHAVEVLPDSTTVTDIDGNVYHTIPIGTQVWMVEDLRTTRYRNGDSIPNVTNDGTWYNLTTGAYCNYDNDPSNAATYGRLYNWFAVSDSRNIAPAGWHVPTDAEWTILTICLGGEGIAGGKVKEAGTLHWNSPNTGATNESGFTALPAGLRFIDGRFGGVGNHGLWWSSSGQTAHEAWNRYIDFNYDDLLRGSLDKKYGYSARCIKD